MDSDWAGSDDSKSTSGYAMYLGGNLIDWRTKKQELTAQSSYEAELIAATMGAKALMGVRYQLEELMPGFADVPSILW